jgi:Zinc finger, C2H2 type/C2H2-type zinc finger
VLIFECGDCDRSFGSQHSLNQHLNTPAHNFECDQCDRSFGTAIKIPKGISILAEVNASPIFTSTNERRLRPNVFRNANADIRYESKKRVNIRVRYVTRMKVEGVN